LFFLAARGATAEGTCVTDLGATGEAAAEQSFAPDVGTISVARRWVEDTLIAWGADDLSWTAMLLVTELSTNAVLHAATAYRVSLDQRKDGTVRIGVSDGSPRKPRARDYGVDATTGRGLGLVGSLAAAWGTSSRPDGKTVWCDLRAEAPSGMAAEPDLDAFLGADDFDIQAPGPSSPGGGAVDAMWAMAA
jgi:anti-sigma regulatory factor (Ser/Thr protein kinase)